MFTWICPKCGNEVPPAYSDCPKCASAAKAEADAAAAPEAPAAAPQEAAPPPAPVAAAVPTAPPPTQNRIYVPGWALSLLFAAVFAIVGLTIILVKQSDKNKSAPAPAKPQATAFENVEPAAVQSDPVLRNLEITALRLTEDNKQKAFVQFVAVNHTGADFGEITAKVDVKAITSKGDREPVGTFAFKVSLGPYESKEVKAPIETKLRVYELPDWQFLRAEITGR